MSLGLDVCPEIGRQVGALELLEFDRKMVGVEENQLALLFVSEVGRPLDDRAGIVRKIDRNEDRTDFDHHSKSLPSNGHVSPVKFDGYRAPSYRVAPPERTNRIVGP